METPSYNTILPGDPDAYVAKIAHAYAFDPTHGYTLERLLAVGAPEEPADFVDFWAGRYAGARRIETGLVVRDLDREQSGWRVFEIAYKSTGKVTIRGWMLRPAKGCVRRGFVVAHGYGGRNGPDFDLPLEESVLFFPCARGLGLSRVEGVSPEPYWHVLHDLQSKSRYLLGGCVEDVWLAASAMLGLFPEVTGHLGYLGSSFGGGVGAMALAWDNRFQRAHFKVPSFGNQDLRLRLATVGSAASLQRFLPRCPKASRVLGYYDAAIAARHIRIPVHCACALFDPAVAPAGQFAVFNALAGPKHLFLLGAGHHPHPLEAEENAALQREIHNFFRAM